MQSFTIFTLKNIINNINLEKTFFEFIFIISFKKINNIKYYII